MLRSIYSGISGMKVNQAKLDVIGNNIANVGTTGFKSSSARFKDMLYQNVGEATSPTSTKGGTNAKQVGLGAQLSSINKVMGQGNALSTGRSLDVCVDGDGYLMVGSGDITGNNVVDSNHGLNGGTNPLELLYTRDGNLTLDHQGNLLTADGYRVMGYNVGDALKHDADKGITVEKYVDPDIKTQLTTDGKLVPLAIPDTAKGKDGNPQPVKKFEIGKDGLITVVLGDGSRAALGQIAMASFKNPEGLVAVGGNKLQISSNSGPTIVKSGIDKTGTDDNSKGFGDFIQGCLEGSNVDLTEQFTDMITATRSFQASSKMISTGDEILQTITGLMR